ncbi:MAG TPA: AAA family ATPase [Polyangia bacterium]
MRATQSTLVEDLLRPASYPAPTPREVALVSTHISWVFLTDDKAWKVRRPVDFGFVDFSTPEKRRRDCEEELRLNRRLAPDVYLGQASVHRDACGHNFLGRGDLVDHAVVMRRLDASSSAAALLARGELQPSHLTALAQCLAAFYQEAPERPELKTLAVLRHNVEENLQGLEASGHFLDSTLLATACASQRRALAALSERLDARRAGGHIRDGHGDLRLEHVYFPPVGRVPLVIDAVEFSERFRCADTALDIAFLVMELLAAGRRDLAEGFAYQFARASQDYDFYPLLDFYVAYRALVRAKIACLLANDETSPPDKAARKRGEAIALLTLATARAESSGTVVVAIGGLVGAGKSTVAEALAQATGMPVVSSDHTRKHLAGLSASARGSPSLYTDDFTQRTRHELTRRAEQVLLSGRSVILDATFRISADRAKARALARTHGARFLFVEVTCDEATLQARLVTRATQSSESDADAAVLAKIRNQFTPPVELPPDERLVVDGRAPVATSVEPVLGAIRRLLCRTPL